MILGILQFLVCATCTCAMVCDPGYYGRNCVQECSVNCGGTRQCDRLTGECEGGCRPGWKGMQCDQKCDSRMYGANCNKTCGYCVNERQCHHINGTCLEGCLIGYHGSLCVEICSDKSPESKSCLDWQKIKQSNNASSLPVYGRIIVAVIVLILLVLSVIVIRRSRTTKKDRDSSIVESSSMTSNSDSGKENNELGDNDYIDDDEIIHAENSYGDMCFNKNTLEGIIQHNQRDDDDGFKHEYAEIPYFEKYPCNAGRLPENIPKNRSKTTFPYDHSRITLANGVSDYVNANYIDGINKTNEYIAAQGPLQNTVEDFWIMICQEYVNHIVMLTNLKEGNKIKCFKYWPDLHQSRTFGVIPLSADEDSNFGVISIHAEEEKIYANYKIRKFRVIHKRLKGSRIVTESRVVTHYHYTAWPEHGIPEPLCLADFHDHVTRTKDKGYYSGPTLVHCSSGTGRTGTYIAIDALYKAGKTERKVNIAEYVKKMRENRMNMVQTYEQYKTIFLAIEVMFRIPAYKHTKPEFVKQAGLRDWYKSPDERELKQKLQSLLRARPSYTEDDYKLARENGDKSAVLPLDKYNVFLSSSVPNRGNYINAVTLSSYTKNNAFIITHYPSPEDAVDFLRLLIDHASDIVICMDPLEDVKSTETWMPSSIEPKCVQPFTVYREFKQVSEMSCKGTPIYICQDGSKNRGFSASIIEPNEIELDQARWRITYLLYFANYLKTEGPITLVSRDGAALCGAFCALHNARQQLSMDGEMDIFSTVRQLQIRRPELCSSMEEYKLIYDGFKYMERLISLCGTCGTCESEIQENIESLKKSSQRWGNIHCYTDCI